MSSELRQYEVQCRRFKIEQMLIKDERWRVDRKLQQSKNLAALAACILGFGGTYGAQTTIPLDDVIPKGVIIAFGAFSAIMMTMAAITALICAMISVALINFDCVKSATAPDSKKFDHFWYSRCESEYLFAFRTFLCTLPLFIVNTSMAGWIQYALVPITPIVVTAICTVTMLFAVFVVLPRWHTAVEGRRWHEAEKTREQIKQ